MSGMIAVWEDAWNSIIRNIIFHDEELKKLMLIPDGTNIIEFIDRYFIRAGYTSKLLKDERVRIVYSDMRAEGTQSDHVTRNQIVFDIFVKLEDIHNVSRDRLQLRTIAIADRLYSLLTQERYVYGYRFWSGGNYDLGTRTIGYARHCLPLNYMKTY